MEHLDRTNNTRKDIWKEKYDGTSGQNNEHLDRTQNIWKKHCTSGQNPEHRENQ